MIGTAAAQVRPQGQQVFTTVGSSSFVAPARVFSVSVVGVGGGATGGATSSGANAGGGAALAYKNNYPVVPGTSYSVTVGGPGAATTAASPTAGSDTQFVSGSVLKAGGGPGAAGGTFTGDGGGNGGAGGNGSTDGGGGGGAGGYSGTGGAGAVGPNPWTVAPTNGSGGGGAGGGTSEGTATGPGGGVGLLGTGANGIAPTVSSDGGPGGAGSGGSGKLYGGGGAGADSATSSANNLGGQGALRAIWGYVGNSPRIYTPIVPAVTYSFAGSTANSWTAFGAALTTGASFLTVTPNTGVINYFIERTGLSISGATNRYFHITWKRTVAGYNSADDYDAIEGAGSQVFWYTSGHAASESYMTYLPQQYWDGTNFITTTVDMHNAFAGRSDWSSSTITGLRVDPDKSNVPYHIQTIEVSPYPSPSWVSLTQDL